MRKLAQEDTPEQRGLIEAWAREEIKEKNGLKGDFGFYEVAVDERVAEGNYETKDRQELTFYIEKKEDGSLHASATGTRGRPRGGLILVDVVDAALPAWRTKYAGR